MSHPGLAKQERVISSHTRCIGSLEVVKFDFEVAVHKLVVVRTLALDIAYWSKAAVISVQSA